MQLKPALLILALFLCLVVPVAADDEAPSLHSQVLEMLEADISEEIVLEWLETVEGPIPRPTPEELIALKKAGATDDLLKALIGLAKSESKGEGVDSSSRSEATAPTSQPAASPPSPERVAAVPEPVREPPARAAEKSTPAAEGVLIDFKLAYQAPKVDFDYELWDLYVYLDGKPLAYVPPNTSVFERGDGIEFRQRLSPGRHVIRVTQERHERRRKNRWRHEARVSEQEFAFDLTPGSPGELEIAFNEGLFSTASDGPLRFRLLQEESVTELEAVGGNPESWPLLCEEIESNLADDGSPDKGFEGQLDGCVRWRDLWSEIDAPGRDAVREAMALFDFRPVPRGS